MLNPKSPTGSLHDRLIGDIESRDRRNHATITLPVADLRRAVRSLASRGDQLLARKDRDPILRLAAENEAGHCRRLAAAINAAIKRGAAL